MGKLLSDKGTYVPKSDTEIINKMKVRESVFWKTGGSRVRRVTGESAGGGSERKQ